MKKLKMRSLKSVILFVIIFCIVAGVGGSSVLPAVKNLFVKPISWDDVDFDGDIEGLYITGTVYGIYDWYCEETLDNRTTGKEYLIDADDKYYMGLHATYSDMDDANALMEASQDYLNGYDDGSDLEDAQYEITGVITKMPDDSLQFYHEYLEWSSMDADERELFLPYYINVDKIGGSYDKVDTIIVSLIALAFFLIGLFMLIRVFTGHYQKSIKKYIAGSSSPDMARERVENFLENTPIVNNLRYNRDFICGQQGGTTIFGETPKLIWVYLQSTVHKRNFITVGTTYSLTVAFADGRRQSIEMKNDQVTREHMQKLSEICPQTIFGYSDELDKMFRKDLNGFLNLKYNTAQTSDPFNM